MQKLLVIITVTSKTIPGLKYLGVFLKLMVYGDVTIGIFSNSASTISLPVELKQRLSCSYTKRVTLLELKCFFRCFVLTTVCEHFDLDKYGASHKIQDIGESRCEVFSSQCDLSLTIGDLQ